MNEIIFFVRTLIAQKAHKNYCGTIWNGFSGRQKTVYEVYIPLHSCRVNAHYAIYSMQHSVMEMHSSSSRRIKKDKKNKTKLIRWLRPLCFCCSRLSGQFSSKQWNAPFNFAALSRSSTICRCATATPRVNELAQSHKQFCAYLFSSTNNNNKNGFFDDVTVWW